MALCVERHDSILRSAIESNLGRVVKSTGDGLMAVFPVADDALDAAIAGRLAIGAEEWAPIPRLRVRMGLPTGSVEPTGHDYFGVVVNRAARVADAVTVDRSRSRRPPPPSSNAGAARSS